MADQAGAAAPAPGAPAAPAAQGGAAAGANGTPPANTGVVASVFSEGDGGGQAAAAPAPGAAAAGAAAQWPENWRETYAGQDSKRLEKLKRYSDPKAALDALFHAHERISKGEAGKVLPENPTPEQLAEYRKAVGIPESHDGYQVKLSNGRVVGEEDKPMVDAFLKRMHGHHARPEMINASLDAYYDIVEMQQKARLDADNTSRMAFQDEMRQDWGPDFRRNVTIINTMLEAAPKGVKQTILNARRSDGTPLASDPATIRWLLGLELERNPAASVMPSSGASAGQSVDEEIAKISAEMAKDHKDSLYWSGPKDANGETQMQRRLRDLNAAKEKMGGGPSRNGAAYR